MLSFLLQGAQDIGVGNQIYDFNLSKQKNCRNLKNFQMQQNLLSFRI